MADGESQTVFRSEIPLISQREVSGSTAIGVVLRDYGIQITRGHIAGGAGAEGVRSPSVLSAGEGSGGIEAAAGKDYLAVQAGVSVVGSVEFDDAAHFAAVLGGNSGGVDGKGVDVIGFDFGTEAGGAIVGEGNTIDNVLSLIFRAAGVENGAAFEEPSRLGVDEVGERAAGEGSWTVGNSPGVEMVDGGGALGIEQGGFGGDVDGSAEGGDIQFDEIVGGERGMNFDQAIVGRERFAVDLKAVGGEGKIADDEGAGIIGGEGAVELQGVTGELDGGFEGEAVGAGDFEAKLSGVALGEEGEGEEGEDEEEDSEVE